MRRNKGSKRLAALMLAAALTVTETIGVLGAMPEAVGGEMTENAEEEFAAPQLEEEVLQTETVSAQTGEDTENASISENTAMAQDSQETDSNETDSDFEEELEFQDKTLGTNGVPAAVTGVTIVKDSDTMKAMGISEPRIQWNYVQGSYKYEFQIKDTLGYVYATDTWKDSAGNLQYYYPYISASALLPSKTFSSFTNCYAYKNDTRVKEGDKSIKPFRFGQTYTISIRAVNQYAEEITQEAYRAFQSSDYVERDRRTESDENGNRVTKYYKVTTFNGPWTAPMTYKAESAGITPPAVLSGLAATSQDDDNVYFTYTQSFQGGTVRYQCATDSNFTDIVKASSTSQGGISGTNKLSVSKRNLTTGKTYYLRAWYENEEGETVEDADGNRIYSNVASFVPAPKEGEITNATPALSGLRLVKITDSAFYFAIGTVLEDKSIDYQLEYGTDPNFEDYISTTNMSISKSDLSAGKVYYVRMRTVNYDAPETVYGTPSNIVTIQRAISGGTISLLELNPNGLVIGHSAEMNKADRLEVWVSTDKDFQNKPLATHVYTASSGSSTQSDRFNISYNNLEPGQTIYIKARCCLRLSSDNSGYKGASYDYGAFSNTLKVKVGVADAILYTDTVTASSIRLSLGSENGGLRTGWELQRKNGNVWEELTKTTTSSYTDKKLKADTEYIYRVRTYYYSQNTKKTTYGDWETMSTMTWGGNLNLVAMAKSKTSVKLTWNKIKGANGYEVYRYVTSSEGYTNYSAKKGSVENFYKYVYVGSTKKTSYTIKNLVGSNAAFEVRAYKNVKGKKYYIDDGVEVCLDFDTLHILSEQLTTKGAKKVTWNPVYSASGYLVEKLDRIKNEWVTFKVIKKAKTTSVTLPASPSMTTKYRIRAFRKGTPKKYSQELSVSVSPFLNAPTKVKAKALADGSVQVTWKAVPGAAYYRVRRTANPMYTYNMDSKQNDMTYGMELDVYIPDASSKTGYRKEQDVTALTGTSFVDRKITYTVNGVESKLNGPEPGVTYYYYVIAYKRMDSTDSAVNLKEDQIIWSADSKPAKACVGSTPDSKKLKAPTISKISSKKKKVTLSWKAVAGAESYVIYRSTKKKKGYTVVGYAENGKTSFKDTNAIKGKTYYYKVKAAVKNDVGLDVTGKSFSKVKQIKVK